MKKLFTIALVMLAISYQTLAQDEAEDKKEKKSLGTHNHFNIDLGTNNYLQDGEFPNDNDAPYSVKPFGSWYVSLRSINDTHIGGPLHLLWGPDVSWYNFKFENENIRLSKVNDQVIFSEVTDLDSKKSKLTVAYINFSAVPMLKFGKDNRRSHRHHHCWGDWEYHTGNESQFRIGAGAYAGYKIGSYTKTVIEDEGDKKKDRDKGSYYLNNFRYGVRVQAGFRGVDVFVNYDLNTLFVENKGPELNAFSFGVVL
ncbi:hypothetical protein JMN32_17580 [Fulvivirga sp. 29W222]|uniref:Outer membrane protein beta-barrel domain-containing protein n=1 Tax=Fulvivirga marina TaxID=2494733 RepID=A0A937FXV1_9BACT|nr:hypothetical protein [Fulvivirga marina]MBL6448134.1 hypothetical protein [Fulvivirga marina]